MSIVEPKKTDSFAQQVASTRGEETAAPHLSLAQQHVRDQHLVLDALIGKLEKKFPNMLRVEKAPDKKAVANIYYTARGHEHHVHTLSVNKYSSHVGITLDNVMVQRGVDGDLRDKTIKDIDDALGQWLVTLLPPQEKVISKGHVEQYGVAAMLMKPEFTKWQSKAPTTLIISADSGEINHKLGTKLAVHEPHEEQGIA